MVWIIHFHLVHLILVVCFFFISTQIFFLSLILDLGSSETSTDGLSFFGTSGEIPINNDPTQDGK
jgi:hypothetical protein